MSLYMLTRGSYLYFRYKRYDLAFGENYVNKLSYVLKKDADISFYINLLSSTRMLDTPIMRL
jgi:hypothetical protein